MVGTTNMTARTIILKAIHDQYNNVSPVFDGKIVVQGRNIIVKESSIHQLQLFSLTGIMIREVVASGSEVTITAPGAGCYLLRIIGNNNQQYTRKILVQP